MGYNNGGGFGVVLILVLVVLAAGFLFSQNAELLYDKEVADQAVVQSGVIAATQAAQLTQIAPKAADYDRMARENEQIRAQMADLQATQQSMAGIIERQAQEKAQLEAAARAAEDGKAEAERYAAQAEREKRALIDEGIRQQTQIAMLEEQGKVYRKQIVEITHDRDVYKQMAEGKVTNPVTGRDQNPSLGAGKLLELNVLSVFGFLFFGTAALVVTWKVARRAPRSPAKPETQVRYNNDTVLVKMTRDEAREFARRKKG
jgi:hypothetical protein